MNDQLSPEPCWFCEEAEAVETSAATVEMHAGGFQGKGTEYRVLDTTSLSIPRCERCQLAHDRVEGTVAKGGIVGLLIGLVIALFLFYSDFDLLSINDDVKKLLLLILVCGMIGGVLAWLIGRLLLPKGIKDQRSREQHPLVREMIREGWKIGPKPPGL